MTRRLLPTLHKHLHPLLTPAVSLSSLGNWAAFLAGFATVLHQSLVVVLQLLRAEPLDEVCALVTISSGLGPAKGSILVLEPKLDGTESISI